MKDSVLFLKKGREKSLLRRHPWIFSGAVDRVEGQPRRGETIRVNSHDGKFLACGAYSPDSQLRARVWSFEQSETVGRDFFLNRIRCALDYREFLGYNAGDGACRLLAAEADGLPGVIADRYGDYIVVQISSAGGEFFKKMIAEALMEATGCRGVYERSDLSARRKEGLEETVGLLAGEMPPELLFIIENGLRFKVDVYHGHKTGFYLDQKENRRVVRELSAGRRVLNCFSYTGTFGVCALKGGAAHVTNVDSSRPALETAEENYKLNSLPDSACDNIDGDVFEYLRHCRESGESFDMIILDPPKFIDSKNALMRGCRAYKDIALLAFRLLKSGGILVNFSCSGLMERALFQKITADAALDAGREALIVRELTQAPDHPVPLSFPEGLYLKGFVNRVC